MGLPRPFLPLVVIRKWVTCCPGWMPSLFTALAVFPTLGLLSPLRRKWYYGGRGTLFGRACPTRQPLPPSASRAQTPWVRYGPLAS